MASMGVSREQAEAIASGLAQAYLDTVFHVVRYENEALGYYVMDERSTSGEIIKGVRVASIMATRQEG